MAALARVDHQAEPAGEQQASVSVDLLLFFTAVAEELSFTRAARRLGIDQSWLSHKIRQLEGELACTLFARTTRRIELTEAGLALLGPAQALARATEDARRAAWAVSAGLQGTLRIGALPYSFLNPDRVNLIDRFIAEHPETEVDVSNGPSIHLLDHLRRGDIDLAFVSWPFESEGLEMLSVRLDRFCILLPRDHRLAALAAIPMEALRGERIVMPSPQHNPHTFKSLYQPFLDAGAVAATVAEFQSDVMFSHAKRHGLMTLCKEVEAERQEDDAFMTLPIAGHDAVSRKCLVRQKGHLTPAIEGFWSLAKAAGGAAFDAVAPR